MFCFKEWLDESEKWDYLARESQLYPEGFMDFANRFLGRGKPSGPKLDPGQSRRSTDDDNSRLPMANEFPGGQSRRSTDDDNRRLPMANEFPGGQSRGKTDRQNKPMGYEDRLAGLFQQVQNGITKLWKDNTVRAIFQNDPSGMNKQKVDDLVKSWNAFKSVINQQNRFQQGRGNSQQLPMPARQRAANRGDHWRG